MEYIAKAFRFPFEFYGWMMSKSDPRTINWPLCNTPFPMLAIIFSYIYFVKIYGPRWMKNRPPFKVEKIVAFYNIVMVIVSAGFLIYGSCLTYLPPWGKYSLLCEPVNYGSDPQTIHMLKISWWYLLLKIGEFLDTIFFVLRKKFSHISHLHVIHHSLVAWGVWIGMKYGAGGSNVFFPLINCFIHTIMYSYYCLAILGLKKYLWWKKYLTILQMLQFVIAIGHALLPFFYDCGYHLGFVYAILFHAVLFMVMFINFYLHTYKQRKTTEDYAIKSNGAKLSGKQQQNGTAGVRKNGTAIKENSERGKKE